METDKAIVVMQQAALVSGQMLLKMQPTVKRLDARKDFLTDADLKSEGIILGILSAKHPGIPSLSEEKGGQETTEGLLWIVDPVDGTVNFFCRQDNWGVSIALAENGKTIAAVVHLPAQKKMFSARCEESSTVSSHDATTFDKVSVSQDCDLRQCQVWTDWAVEENEGRDHQRVIDILAKLDRHTLYPQLRLCCVAGMMNVAEGNIAAYVHTKPKPFDIAAAGLIVERAGGMVTDIQGKPWTAFSRSIVASNGRIHRELLDVLNQ